MTDMHVVLFQRDKWWVAQCLEYDVGAQGYNPEDAIYELNRSLVGHVAICIENKVEPFVALGAAPQRYWDLWKGAKISLNIEREPFRSPLPFRIPEPHVKMATA